MWEVLIVEKRVEGVITAVVTPFDSQGRLIKKDLEKLLII